MSGNASVTGDENAMPTLEVTIQVKQDGVPVAGFPLTRRVSVDELQSFEVEIPAHGSTSEATTLPAQYLDSTQLLIVIPNRAVTVGNPASFPSGYGTQIAADGIYLVVNGVLGLGLLNAVNNLSGATASIRGLAAGT